ncbi:hypothetical protein EIP91_003298 [Steccherinum ochraceum]|uniref:F-box domain-containing protein n=1 Tax=Steccherinum ochraceum TaxID=92696 RepID=A0A4R0RAS4_9APHY|nr:hypothetical protein EIP91_003298 [Steccherinum ochraceum]
MPLSKPGHGVCIPTELIDQIVLDLIAHGQRNDVKTCALLCKQWHDVTLRHTFRRVTFLLYKENNLAFFQRIISLYPWLASHVREVTLRFKPILSTSLPGSHQLSGGQLLSVLDALPQLAPQLQVLIFNNVHCRKGWGYRTLFRRLQSLPPISTLKCQECTLRITDIKMLLRAFPNIRHLDITSTVITGDLKLALTPPDVPTLSFLRLNLRDVERLSTYDRKHLVPAVFKLFSSTVAINGISRLTLDLEMYQDTLGKWSGVMALFVVEPVSSDAIDLSANVELHTVVFLSYLDRCSTVDGTEFARVLNTIRPGKLRRLMAYLPESENNADPDEAIPSYAALLSQSRFESLTEICLLYGGSWWRNSRDRFKRIEDVKSIFVASLPSHVSIEIMHELDYDRVVNRWEQETIAEDG